MLIVLTHGTAYVRAEGMSFWSQKAHITHYFDPMNALFKGTRAPTMRLHVKTYSVTKYAITVVVK